MARPYPRLVGANKIKDEYTKINTISQYAEETETRVDTIIAGGGPDKDAELVDIRTPDPSYTPQRTISVAGDMTRDMQAQFMSHKAEITSLGIGVGVNPTVAADLNNALDNGWTLINDTTLNRPPNITWGICRTDRRSPTSGVYQTAYRTDTAIVVMSIRKLRGDGTWADWIEVITERIVMTGSGSPEGVVVASPGTLYRRTTGELWLKKTGTGNTGWGQVTVS